MGDINNVNKMAAKNSNYKSDNKLYVFEISFYFIIVILNIVYMIYSVYKAGEEYFDEYFIDLYNDFDTGWSWTKRRKDAGDSEWVLGIQVLNITLPILFLHLLVSEFLKNYKQPKLIELWHIFTGVFFVITYLGYHALILFLLQPIAYFMVVQLKSRKIIWIVTIMFLISQHFFVNLPKTKDNADVVLDHRDKLDITIISLAWTNLRCVNFFLDAVDDQHIRKISARNIVKLLSYVLYLPLFYFGPIILFSDFRSSNWYSSKRVGKPFCDRFIILLSELLRYVIWWFVFDLMLHFLYVNVFLYHTDYLKVMNYHALYGLGYLMGQLFHVKYVIFYGISCSLTKFELECPVPPLPKCISRIHLYSDMWKNFDRGLYLFMVKYIYKPCAKEAGSLLSSLICFTFVFIWHGLYPHVLIWSLLNYIGVSTESFGKELMKMDDLKGFNEIDAALLRRFKCLLATPLLLMSAIAFFYYHGGKEIGDIFVQKILFGDVGATLLTLFVLYCFCQVCTEIDRLEIKFKNAKHYYYYLPPCLQPIKKKKLKRKQSKLDKQRELFDLLAQQNRIRKTFFTTDKLVRCRSMSQINFNPNYASNLGDSRLSLWIPNDYSNERRPLCSEGQRRASYSGGQMYPQTEEPVKFDFIKEPNILCEPPTKEFPPNDRTAPAGDTHTDLHEEKQCNKTSKIPKIDNNPQVISNKPPKIPKKLILNNEQTNLTKSKVLPDKKSFIISSLDKVRQRNVPSSKDQSSPPKQTTGIIYDSSSSDEQKEEAQDKKNIFTRIDMLCKSKLTRKRKKWNIEGKDDNK